MYTVLDLVVLAKGREDYEICEQLPGSFYYDGVLDFELDFSCKTQTTGQDFLNLINESNVPLDTPICIWDSDDCHSYNLTHEGFRVDEKNKRIILVCKPFR